jgi:hypothetical protein
MVSMTTWVGNVQALGIVAVLLIFGGGCQRDVKDFRTTLRDRRVVEVPEKNSKGVTAPARVLELEYRVPEFLLTRHSTVVSVLVESGAHAGGALIKNFKPSEVLAQHQRSTFLGRPVLDGMANGIGRIKLRPISAMDIRFLIMRKGRGGQDLRPIACGASIVAADNGGGFTGVWDPGIPGPDCRPKCAELPGGCDCSSLGHDFQGIRGGKNIFTIPEQFQGDPTSWFLDHRAARAGTAGLPDDVRDDLMRPQVMPAQFCMLRFIES